MTLKGKSVLAIGLAALIASPYLGIPGWSPSTATVAFLVGISLIGLNLVFGYCGMLALGQSAFSALSAYAAGMLTMAGMPNIAAIVLGLAIAILTARLIAEIFIRLPGIYLAVGTLGFAYVVEGLARAFPGVTGGASGLVLTPPFRLTETGWYVLAVVAFGVALASFAVLVSGRMARTLKLVNRDELAAEVSGINVVKTKIFVFTVGAAYSAVGGLILAYYTTVITPEAGGANTSLEYLAMVIIGGAGSILGPLFGAVTINWLFSVSGGAAEYELLVYGSSFLLVVLFAPSGLAGLLQLLWAKLLGEETTEELIKPSNLVPKAAAPAGASTATVGLSAANVSKRFGGLQAVRDVSLEARPGEIVALLGPNGAGKSTFFNILSGIEIPESGDVFLNGAKVTRLPIHARAITIGRSFQVPRLVTDMTVLDNIMTRADRLYPGETDLYRRALALHQLEDFGLGHLASHRVSNVAAGLHKIIDFARAAVGAPELVLLDEPAVGLAKEELDRLRDLIRKMKQQGSAVVIVDHNVEFIMSIADRMLVMESGSAIAFGQPKEVIADPRVRSAYMGVLA